MSLNIISGGIISIGFAFETFLIVFTFFTFAIRLCNGGKAYGIADLGLHFFYFGFLLLRKSFYVFVTLRAVPLYGRLFI